MDGWDWLARSMSGRSRVVKANSGADGESEKKTSEELRLLSLTWLRRSRLIQLISKLWAEGLIQIILFFDNPVSGINIIVGIMTFDVGEG